MTSEIKGTSTLFRCIEDKQAIVSFARSVESKITLDDPDAKDILRNLATRISASPLPKQYPFLEELLKSVFVYLNEEKRHEITRIILPQVEAIKNHLFDRLQIQPN